MRRWLSLLCVTWREKGATRFSWKTKATPRLCSGVRARECRSKCEVHRVRLLSSRLFLSSSVERGCRDCCRCSSQRLLRWPAVWTVHGGWSSCWIATMATLLEEKQGSRL
ncbi:hypothetical protein BT93_D1067 [Corymbia citriodora subsp. variegata]|nr:hypothetical protein BT93_D1067 [Corymbia citriodora subsp. variegata]